MTIREKIQTLKTLRDDIKSGKVVVTDEVLYALSKVGVDTNGIKTSHTNTNKVNVFKPNFNDIDKAA